MHYLYEPEKKVTNRCSIAIDCETILDTKLLREMEKDLEACDVPLSCSLIDIQTLSEDQRTVFIKHGVCMEKYMRKSK